MDLPGFIKAEDPKCLPKDVQFTDEAIGKLHGARKLAMFNLGLGALHNVFNSWDEIEDYRMCFTPFVGAPPPAADNWESDIWYGTQFLNGCNPDTIKRCRKIPSNFPVTNEMVANLLDTTLAQAIKARQKALFVYLLYVYPLFVYFLFTFCLFTF